MACLAGPAVTGHTVSGRVRGRGWAYVGTVLGAAVSVAANIAHSYVPPACLAVAVSAEHAPCTPPPEDWAPPTGAVIGSALWPVLVVVAVEILTRVEWPDEGRWLLARWGGLLPVALVAAIISYGHLRGLLLHWGEGEIGAALGPLAPDGLMVIASSALLIRRPDTSTVPAVPDAVPAGTVPVHTPAPVAVAVSAPPVEHVHAVATAPDTAAPDGGHAPVPEHVPAPDATPDAGDRTDAEHAATLRTQGVTTIRGAMRALGCGQTRARRALAIAWPDTPP